MNRTFLVVVNPKAGRRRAASTLQATRDALVAYPGSELVVWKDPAVFDAIRVKIESGRFTDVVAVGGDGTINQVAAAVAGSNVRLGILPAGSGNGLALSLGLHMDPLECLADILACRVVALDQGIVNNVPFFCTSGVGFDAHVGALFADSPVRGLKTYTKIVVREILRYKPGSYEIRTGRSVTRTKAFLITVANAGQFGNDFYIAPEARPDDGLFHVTVIRPFPFYALPGLLLKALRKRIHRSRYVDTLTARELTITPILPAAFHYDGEPAVTSTPLHFELVPGSLKAIVGKKFGNAAPPHDAGSTTGNYGR